MTRRTAQDNDAKFLALVEIVKGIQPFYQTANASARQLIETTVGAAIFYLPGSKTQLWSGMISESLKGVDRSKWCADHMYPRKVSAIKLLGTNWSAQADPVVYLKDLYVNELGRFHYVTKQENARLKQFQKPGDFIDPARSYELCGIRLVSGH